MTTERRYLKRRLQIAFEQLGEVWGNVKFVADELEKASDPQYKQFADSIVKAIEEVGKAIQQLNDSI